MHQATDVHPKAGRVLQEERARKRLRSPGALHEVEMVCSELTAAAESQGSVGRAARHHREGRRVQLPWRESRRVAGFVRAEDGRAIQEELVRAGVGPRVDGNYSRAVRCIGKWLPAPPY